jgi:hypothetical protein
MPLIPCRNKTNCTIILRFLTWGLLEVNGDGMRLKWGQKWYPGWEMTNIYATKDIGGTGHTQVDRDALDTL